MDSCHCALSALKETLIKCGKDNVFIVEMRKKNSGQDKGEKRFLEHIPTVECDGRKKQIGYFAFNC